MHEGVRRPPEEIMFEARRSGAGRLLIVALVLAFGPAFWCAPRAAADEIELEGRPAKVVEAMEKRIEKMDKKLDKQLEKIEKIAEKRFTQRSRRIKEDCVDIPFVGEECLVDEKQDLSLEQRMDRAFRALDEGSEKLEKSETRQVDKLLEIAFRTLDKLEVSAQKKGEDLSGFADARMCLRDVVAARAMEFEARLLESRERVETRLMELFNQEMPPAP